MDIDVKKIRELEQELEKIDTNEMIKIILNILANKHNLKHRFIFALINGISLEKLADMYNLINNKKDGNLNELIQTFNNNFPDHKDKIYELVECFREEGLFTDFCDRFLNSPEVKEIIDTRWMSYSINLSDLFPEIN